MEKQETADVKQQPVNNKGVHLDDMYRQVKGLEPSVLFSGLTILVKDTAVYLTACGMDDDRAEAFRLAYLAMLNHNRDYWQQFDSRLYRPLKEARLPEGFASGAAQCDVTLSPLTDPYWGTVEWLRAPGWHFFKAYSAQRKSDIFRPAKPKKSEKEENKELTLGDLKTAFYEGKNPYEPANPAQQREEETDPFKPVEAVVKRLADSEQQDKSFWYPVMLYLVLLMHKTNFETLEDAEG